MPLVGLVDGDRVTGPLLSVDDWAELARAARRGERVVTLPFCGQPAYPSHSPMGTQHFVHKPGPYCQTHGGPETIEHLIAKTIILKAAIAAGWEADAEHPGAGWIADVWAQRNSQQVAFEVQWSKQEDDMYTFRQQRYAAAGVRCAWFVRHEESVPYSPTSDLPIFHLAKTADTEFDVTVGWTTSPLAAVVTRLLEGRIRFRSHIDGPSTRRIELLAYSCWRCGSPTTIWLDAGNFAEGPCGMGRLPSGILDAVYDIWQDPDRPETARDVRAAAAAAAAGNGLPPLAQLSRRYSKTTESTYMAFSCPQCGALYGDFFLQEWLMDREYEPADAVATLPGGPVTYPHWCVDTGGGHCGTR